MERRIEWTTKSTTSSSTLLHEEAVRVRRCLERPLWRRTADCTVLQVQQKLASYVSQDKRKGRSPARPPLTVAATLELLESAAYRCLYCQRAMTRVWRLPRDPLQWTLDRVDNDRPHQIDNVVPSCMECNLRRRARDHARFRHGAQIVLACSRGDDEECHDVVRQQQPHQRHQRRRAKEEWVVVKN